MRVLVGPRLDLGNDPPALGIARLLAGEEGSVLSLREMGVRNLGRPLSAAEVALLREALGGGTGQMQRGHSAAGPAARTEPAVVGYVCRGRDLGRAMLDQGAAVPSGAKVLRTLVTVTDHANLVWRSPLTGPNDDSVGPRFPSMTGIYDPGRVNERLRTGEGMIVTVGVVAGVRDDERLNAFEKETAESRPFSAVSSELVPVAIVAAHMGLRVAAVIIIAGS